MMYYLFSIENNGWIMPVLIRKIKPKAEAQQRKRTQYPPMQALL